MNVYKVTLEDDDGNTHTVTVPANSKKDARKKADNLYGDDVVSVTTVEDDDTGSDSKTENGDTETSSDSDVEVISVEEVSDDEGTEDSSDSGEGSSKDENDSAEASDEKPETEHWFYRRRKSAA